MSVIVGITHSYENDFVKLNMDYIRAVSMFGAVSLIISYSQDVEDIINLTDGIILSGGGDLSEYLVSEKIDPRSEDIYRKRDIFEAELCRKAFYKDIPLLGICRGAQVMNNALGGKIRQHIDGHLSKYSDSKNTVFHKIFIDKDSGLFKIAGNCVGVVNSFHHQCVSEISPELTVCAVSEDSVIEAVEGRGKNFFLGVQWHPEKTIDDDLSKNIFREFIHACSKRKFKDLGRCPNPLLS